jgi:protein-S-isoprenylcysteine O-methyltransferase Ste14
MAGNPQASLASRALPGLAQFLLVMAVLLFLPAWTLSWWQAWLFLIVFGAAVTVITLHFLKADPALIERRLKAGPGAEKEQSQRIIQLLASLAFVAMIVFPAIDHRLGWSHLAVGVVLAGDALVALGLLAIFLVFRENSYTSGVIEVGGGQTVVSTGLYRIVRHPMYAGALVMLVGMPLALGSAWGLLLWFPMAALMVIRLLDEERYLAANLAGYRDYQAKTRRRLIPGIF